MFIKTFQFQFQFLTKRNSSLKTTLLLIILLFCFSNSNAQDGNGITLRIEPGFLILTNSDNLGLLLNVEPHVKISKNSVIGLRFGVALNSQKVKNNDSSQFFINDLDNSGVISILPTFDYYLNANKYRPYMGLGIGYYLFNYLDVRQRNGSSMVLEGHANNQLGVLLRGGFQFGSTRLGLEYNFIPEAEIKIPDGQTVGTVQMSYLGVSIGFTIGRGKR